MITTAATAGNIGLIVETIITSHTGMAYLVEYQVDCARYNARRTLALHSK